MKNKYKYYTKKPIVVDALQFTGNNVKEVFDFTGMDDSTYYKDSNAFVIPIEDGVSNFLVININNYIVRDYTGKLSSWDATLFEDTYQYHAK